MRRLGHIVFAALLLFASVRGASAYVYNWVNVGLTGSLVNGSICTTDGTVINCSTSAINLASQATGILSTAMGGTGAATVAAGMSNLLSDPLTGIYQLNCDGSSCTPISVADGSGIVNSGVQYQMAYYAADGTSVSGNANIYTNAANDLIVSTGKLAIGTTSASNTLTVNGTLATLFGSNYSTTGAQSDVAINDRGAVRYTGAGAATFNGIVAGTSGQILYLHNGSSSTLTLANLSASEATPANQIATGTDQDLIIPANGAVTLQYDSSATNTSGASGTWRVIGGNGSSVWSKSGDDIYNNNAGNVGIGTTSPVSSLHVATGGLFAVTGTYGAGATLPAGLTGAGTRAFFYPNLGAFRAGTVSGTQWDTIGNYSVAMGNSTTASGSQSTAFGSTTVASGSNSTAFGAGAVASNYYATAMGRLTTASGYHTTAMGYYTTAAAYGDFVIGQYNVGGGTADTWVSTEPIFEIGIGTSASNKANAVTVLKNGYTGIGSTTPGTTLDVAGPVRVQGTGSETCDNDHYGMVRYNSTTGRMQVCYGSPDAPSYGVTFTTDPITSANQTAAAIRITSGVVDYTYNYSITSSGGGSVVTGSGTISSVPQNITGLNLSGLIDGTLVVSLTLTDTQGSTGGPATDTVVKSAGGGGGTCSVPGDVCADGTIFAGSDSNGPIYTLPCDQGMTGTKDNCTGTRLNFTWDDGSGTDSSTGATSATDGMSNTTTLYNFGTGPSPAPFRAARACRDLGAVWYLPATTELVVLFDNKDAIGSFVADFYWSSTELTTNNASDVSFGAGTTYNSQKNYGSAHARCVRR
jgi:hypothetical protein